MRDIGKTKVSVVLPVYNGEAYIDQAINSILQQTYKDFELIIINDGSTDESLSVIKKFKDPRIRIYSQDNQGLSSSLNRAIRLAKGVYIARQDADDVSLPTRLEKQVRFLDFHQNCGMVGTWAAIRIENRKIRGIHRHPTHSGILKFELLFDNPFVHSSVMIRKETLEQVGLYSTDGTRQPPEDYELWCRIAKKYEVANIPEILQIYREVQGSLCRRGKNPFFDQVITLSQENLAYFLGRKTSVPAVADLAALAHGAFHRVSPKPSFPKISRFLFEAAGNIGESLDARGKILLSWKVAMRWLSICRHYARFLYRCT